MTTTVLNKDEQWQNFELAVKKEPEMMAKCGFLS
jgi:hypothetical protein